MKKIIFIVGPTASGKTSLSIEVARKINEASGAAEGRPLAEIISADSRQVFKDLDLSTGKIAKKEMENIPHHMLDIISPGEYFSVVDYTNMTLKLIDEIFERGNTPIVVGGTGFYIDSLLYKYNLPEVRANFLLRKKLALKKNVELFEILQNLDQKFADKHGNMEFKNNPHRMMRAIEIATELGQIPELKKELRFTKPEYEVEILHTNLSREELKENIHKRLLMRIESGMIEEIERIKEKYDLSYGYLNSLGLEFRWVAKFLEKEISEVEMFENLKKQIYQYARRQEAWFKRYRNML